MKFIIFVAFFALVAVAFAVDVAKEGQAVAGWGVGAAAVPFLGLTGEYFHALQA